MSPDETVHVERRLGPEEGARLCSAAQDAFRQGELEQARELFVQARNHDPFAWRPLQGLGVVAFRQERLDDAWSLLLAAFEAAPDDEDNAENLAAVGRALDRSERVEILLLQAAKRFPQAPHLAAFLPVPGIEARRCRELCAQGEELLGLELWREAQFPFMEALEHEPRDPAAWNGMGISCWRQGFRQVGLEAFRKAVECLPSDEDSVLNYAESLTRLGQENALLGQLLGLAVPRELCAKVMDLLPEWRSAG